MKIQLFNFNDAEIRCMRDENGEFWFVAKDVCAALTIPWRGDTLNQLRESWKLNAVIPHAGQNRKTTFINEAAMYKLAFRSNKPEAEAFTDWVASDVLPTLRKTGTYSLQGLLLPAPSTWQKTFPDEFMRQVLRLYGYEFDRAKGTPSFVGHFINKYIYNTLDRRMSAALKERRAKYAAERGIAPDKVDDVAFLHQFLNTEGKDSLANHVTAITAIASGTPNIEVFDGVFERAFANRNQLELYLR